MYTAPKSVRRSAVHQTYVVIFLNILILIQDTNIHLKKKKRKQLKLKFLPPKKGMRNVASDLKESRLYRTTK